MNITPRSIFNIILKIFGLFFLREMINTTVVTVLALIKFFSIDDIGLSIGMLIVEFLILLFYVVLIMLLLFKTNKIIDLLKLDHGFFQDEFSFEEKQEKQISLTTKQILIIALIVLGGVILVTEIPNFCKLLYLFFEEKKSLYVETTNIIPDIIVSFAKILIGLLILGERTRIIDFIESKKPKGENIDI